MKDEVIKIINKDIYHSGYKLDHTHCRSGGNLHMSNYYFVNKFFQKKSNCRLIANLIQPKINEICADGEYTIVGYKNFLSLLLSKITQDTHHNFATIEEYKNSFSWRFTPKFKQKVLIILPISSTYSTYFKIRRWITSQTDFNSEITADFICIFTILDSELKKYSSIKFNESDAKRTNPKLHKIYTSFGWNIYTKDSVILGQKNSFKAHIIIKLFNVVNLPEDCLSCFPTKIKDEKPLYHINEFENYPNLIFGFPKYYKKSKFENFLIRYGQSGEKEYPVVFGHIKANNNHYLHYIRSNVFFVNNQKEIIKFFVKKIIKHLEPNTKSITFISADHKHSSTVIETLALHKTLRKYETSIIRFDSNVDYIDDFLSINRDIIYAENNLLIYFEDVISIGKTFKLISDNIKHLRPKNLSHYGLDLAFTLIDRTSSNTENEIVKKLRIRRSKKSSKGKFVAYSKLRIPVLSNLEFGNPLHKRLADLLEMKSNCKHDSLKIHIANEINKIVEKDISVTKTENRKKGKLRYFPFCTLTEKKHETLFKTYENYRRPNSNNLIEIYLIQAINQKFAHLAKSKKSKKSDSLIKFLLDDIVKNKTEEIFDFISSPNSIRRNRIEERVIHDKIVKILCKPPFILYKNIRDALFSYCLKKLVALHKAMDNNEISRFSTFRTFKFYIKRSIELNSNFILSYHFLSLLKKQNNPKRIDEIIAFHSARRNNIESQYRNGEFSKEFYDAAIENIDYKLDSVKTYFNFLHFCFKEILHKNTHKSIKLEELLNSRKLLPEEIISDDTSSNKVKDVIQDPYFQFTGKLKSENVFLIGELKELHKNYVNAGVFDKIKDLHEYYFVKRKSDPIVINAKKLITKSRYALIRKKVPRQQKIRKIKDAICLTLQSSELLMNKQLDDNDNQTHRNFESEIKSIIHSICEILTPGLDAPELNYGLFFKYKNQNEDVIVNTEDIHSILSNVSWSEGKEIKLNNNGFICNFLTGLRDTKHTIEEQSFLILLNYINDKVVSFHENYLSNSGTRVIDIDTAFRHDVYDLKNKTGIKFLESKGITMAFRLSKIESQENKEGVNAMSIGESVLLIKADIQPNMSNLFNFMSNEKLRLVMLLKDELSDYLHKQFTNDAFLEVLENKRNIIYQNQLRHGIGDYLVDQSELVNKIKRGENVEDNEYLFKTITNAIRGQLKAVNINMIPIDLTRMEFIKMVSILLDSDLYGKIAINPEELDVSNLNFDSIEVPKSFKTIIIPEVILNMKKYSPRIERDIFSIEFNNDEFIFKNSINEAVVSNTKNREGEGLNLCNSVIKKITGKDLDYNFDNNVFILKIKIKK